jgi:hypothetical protein
MMAASKNISIAIMDGYDICVLHAVHDYLPVRTASTKSCISLHHRPIHLSWVEIDENIEVNFTPRPLTTAMIATEIPAAMSPYSMAVAPRSSLKKEDMRFFIGNSSLETPSVPQFADLRCFSLNRAIARLCSTLLTCRVLLSWWCADSKRKLLQSLNLISGR